jgi:enterobactin synthetase component D
MSAYLSSQTTIETAAFISSCVNKSRQDYAAFELAFDVAAYSDSAYKNLHIVFPETLVRAVAKRKAEFLAGRYAALHCFKQLVLEDKCTSAFFGKDFDLKIGPHRSPSWPTGLVGSITHTNGIASALVASKDHYVGVGVDIESWLSQESAEQIRASVLTGNDYSQFNPQKLLSGEICEAHLLTLIFSAKETLFKALYPSVGHYFDFKDAELTELDYTRQYLRLRLLKSLGAKPWLQKHTEHKVAFLRRSHSVLTYLLVAL